jgi:exopolysaccharide biosynthesis operon protein EpsL
MPRYRLISPAPIVAAGLGFISPFIALPVQADEQDMFNIQFAESFARDNNLFRLPDNVDPATRGLGKSSRGDNIRTDSLSLTGDKRYSLQRFHIGARYDANHYGTYDFLDHSTRNFDGQWNWSLTPHVTGLLAAERTQALNNFADIQSNYVRSVRTTDTVRGNSEFGSIGALRFVAGIAQSKTTSTEPIQQDWNTRTRSVDGGLRYLTAAENSIGYRYRENRVVWQGRPLDSVNLYDIEARQADHEVFGLWKLAAQATLDGAVTRVNRRHDNFAERDYSGTAARLNVNWIPDAQVQAALFAKREYGSWWTNTASYTITDSIGITPTWRVATKVTLYGRVEQSRRDFRGPVVVTTADQRLDKERSALLGIDWEPLRNFLVGGSVLRSNRSSNLAGLDYTDTYTSVKAQIKY